MTAQGGGRGGGSLVEWAAAELCCACGSSPGGLASHFQQGLKLERTTVHWQATPYLVPMCPKLTKLARCLRTLEADKTAPCLTILITHLDDLKGL